VLYVQGYQRFKSTYCLHPQCRSVRQASKQTSLCLLPSSVHFPTFHRCICKLVPVYTVSHPMPTFHCLCNRKFCKVTLLHVSKLSFEILVTLSLYRPVGFYSELGKVLCGPTIVCVLIQRSWKISLHFSSKVAPHTELLYYTGNGSTKKREAMFVQQGEVVILFVRLSFSVRCFGRNVLL
jgi:hypothetical protein